MRSGCGQRLGGPANFFSGLVGRRLFGVLFAHAIEFSMTSTPAGRFFRIAGRGASNMSNEPIQPVNDLHSVDVREILTRRGFLTTTAAAAAASFAAGCASKNGGMALGGEKQSQVIST